MGWCPDFSSNSNSPPPQAYSGPLINAFWSFQYSPGMGAPTAAAGGGFQFPMPNLPASVHYLVAAINRPVQAMRMDIEFVCSPDAVFTARIPGGSSVDEGVPGPRFYFQRRGDDLSGAGEYQQFRWWCNASKIEAKPGRFQVSAAIDPAQWSDVYGKPGTDAPNLFNLAVANCAVVGMTFGGNMAGHGVALTAGSAVCTVHEFNA